MPQSCHIYVQHILSGFLTMSNSAHIQHAAQYTNTYLLLYNGQQHYSSTRTSASWRS